MTVATATSRTNRKSKPSLPLRPWMLWLLAAVFVLALPGAMLANKYWPYRYRNVKPLLQDVLASQIKIDKYHRVYFPSPGFVATGITMRRNTAPDLPPVGTIDHLIVKGSWLDLLTLRDRVQLVDVVGLHVTIPPVGSRANHKDFPAGSSADFAGPTTAVEELRFHEATLDIQRTNGGLYRFPIKTLVIRNLQKGQKIRYDVDMQNAIPSGHILSKGTFGPLNPNDLGSTPLAGDFTFTDVKLNDIGGVDGMLTASDHFQGRLDAIQANATAQVPDFAIDGGTATVMNATIQALVDGLDGGIILQQVELTLGKSKVEAQGSILGAPKLTNLDVSVAGGRVQDLMKPFLKKKPPLTGAVWIKSHVTLTPAANGATFLQRLKVDGGFNVPAERIADRTTEQSLSAFSERAQGLKSARQEDDSGPDTDAVSSLTGQVAIRDGLATTQNLTFQVAGASATLAGSFRLHTDDVHLTGNLRMDTDISHVTTGFKSLLLKPLDPFFKRKHAGAVVPIAVTGKPGSYKVGEDIGHTK